jgi:hypothetical protein
MCFYLNFLKVFTYLQIKEGVKRSNSVIFIFIIKNFSKIRKKNFKIKIKEGPRLIKDIS